MDRPVELESHPQAAALIANITQLMDEAEQMLRDSTSQHAEAQVALFRTSGDDLATHLGHCWSSAGRALAASARRSDRAIRSHPYESLAVALGLGIVCGAIWARRST